MSWAIFGLGAWRKRSAQSIPRGTTRATWVGLAVTAVLLPVAVLALNWHGQAGPNPIWMVGLASLVVAVPLVVVGAGVARGRR